MAKSNVKEAHAKAAKTSAIKAAHIPLELDKEAVGEQVAEHQKTVETTEQVNVNNLLGVSEEGGPSKIFDREREIIESKMVGEGAQSIKFKTLMWGDNVRTDRSLQLEAMIASLKRRGYMPKYPIVVSKKAGNKYLVLCGNRRTEGLKKIEEAEPDIFKQILPDGNIPAIVLENLTADEEIIVRNDHSSEEDRVGLDDEGLFYSVKQLVKAGYSSQNDIATKLNLFVPDRNNKEVMVPNRSFVQQRINLARLPQFVQDEFVKLMRDGKHATNVRWSQVATLFKLYMDGRRNGDLDGGPKFIEAWDKAKAKASKDGDGEGEGDGSESKVMSKKAIQDLATQLSSHHAQMFLMKVSGGIAKDQKTGAIMDWGDIDGSMIRAEQALQDILDIGEHLGQEKFNKLMTDITKTRLQKEKKAAE